MVEQSYEVRLDILDNAIQGVIEAEAGIDAALQSEDRPQLVRAVNEWRERIRRVRLQLGGAYEDLETRSVRDGVRAPLAPRVDERTAQLMREVHRSNASVSTIAGLTVFAFGALVLMAMKSLLAFTSK